MFAGSKSGLSKDFCWNLRERKQECGGKDRDSLDRSLENTHIIPHYEPLIAKLADHDVDLIHPEGAPPFMVLGYKGEAELIKKWEKKYKVPIFTSGTNHIRALEALKVKRFIGASYFPGKINETFGKYFEDAGFDVLGMEGIDVPFQEVGNLSAELVYAHVKKIFLKH